VGLDITQSALQDLMVPALVSPELGLLDASGVAIARFLRERFDLPAANAPQVSFDDVSARAGRQPLAIGGRRWHTDASGHATGHWVAVRRFESPRLVLANPGGTGPNFGQQGLDPDDFAQRGPFSAVWIDVDVAQSGGFVIAHTDGQGVNVRAEPNAGAIAVKALREGTRVNADEFAWRQVTDPSGVQGWMADAFLTRVDAQFRVANTDGQGARLRGQPGVSDAQSIKLVAEGTLLIGAEHAWRHVTDIDGTAGWIADEFLQDQR